MDDESTCRSLTKSELREIFQSCKTSRFAKEPDFSEVLKLVSKKLDVQPCEKLITDIEDEFKKYSDNNKKIRKSPVKTDILETLFAKK